MHRFILIGAWLLASAAAWAQNAPPADASVGGVKSANILQLSDADSDPKYKNQTNAERGKVQPGNNAPVWREARSGESFFTTNRGPEAGVLIQSEGDTWRHIRNGPVTLYGGILLVAILFNAYSGVRRMAFA